MDSNMFLVIFSLVVLVFPSSATLHEHQGVSNLNTPYGMAEKLIKSLNLFPKDAVVQQQQVMDDLTYSKSKIVEKSFSFPGLLGYSPSIENLGHHAGYYPLKHSYAARMFYFFFESRTSKKDPVVIWLTGGPGCASELALFYENGPFKVLKNMSLVWNDYGWDQASNIIFVDQPTGTGFSYSTDQRDFRTDETASSNDLYDFLQAFFTAHPELAENDFFITGESYAGHYIPKFASRVQKGNVGKEGIHINLKGFAIGNGLTDPAIQYRAYTDYALQMKMIQQSDHDTINNQLLPQCEQDIKLCGTNGGEDCINAFDDCTLIFSEIMDIFGGNRNHYDIRKKCVGQLCYDFSNMEEFLNLKTVRTALGVGNIEFVSCSPSVYQRFETDWMLDYEVGIPALLADGINTLIYAGEYDFICNWLGNSRWVEAMGWSGQTAFVNKTLVPFMVDGAEAGLMKSEGPLTFLKVHNAGHLVPMDQPKAALEMLKLWTQGKLGANATQI